MPRLFLPLIILSIVACCIEVDISVPSFPDMAHYFNVSGDIIQMTIAYNLLGFGVGALAYGPLSDSYGRRPIMLWGNGILLIGAVGCVIAPSIPILLATRFLQGIGAAASAVVAFAMIADVYPGKEKSAALLGIMNAVFTGIMAFAPLLGGFINEAVSWRGNYGVVALICLVSWIFLVFTLPETKKSQEPFRPQKIGLDYIQLLTNFPFLCASIVPSMLYGIYLSFIAQASFLYTETFQLSVMEYVFHQAVILITFAVVSLFSGKITHKIGARKSVNLGMLISLVGSVGLVGSSIMFPTSPNLTTLFMSLVCLGSAISYPVIFGASLEIFPEIKGTSSSLIMSMRSLVCFCTVAVTGYCYNGHSLRIALLVLMIFGLSTLFTLFLLKSNIFKGGDTADTNLSLEQNLMGSYRKAHH
jgi:DHA1 family bicyclomycin/chloramphenicol resistance-like MFS transporter